MAAGLAFQAAGLGWFVLQATGQPSYGTLVLPLVLAGVGISMALVERERECAEIERLLENATGGESGTLVSRHQPRRRALPVTPLTTT